MKSNLLNASRFILIALILVLAGSGTRSLAADPCDISSLPREVQTKLAADYADWQPQKLKSLDDYSRAYWTKTHPEECPGISIGHFESKTELSYALFLVVKPGSKQQGASIVVFSRMQSSGAFVPHVVHKWETGNSLAFPDLVISKVPPGQYEGYAESDEVPKVSILLDSLLYEAIGKASSLYYWKNGRYQQLVTSD